MEQPAAAADTSSFAGLLASLAAPAKASDRNWEDDGLADDVAELSYEGALRRQTQPARALERRRSSQPAANRVNPAQGAFETSSDDGEAAAFDPPTPLDEERISIVEVGLPANEDGGRTERVTLRLNRSEVLKLRARAAESGLTVSAYLRTCILEVESLRAQVKDALVRMRAPEVRDEPPAAQSAPRFGPQAVRRWRERLFPHWRSSERAECA
jgi:hypothetical protein